MKKIFFIFILLTKFIYLYADIQVYKLNFTGLLNEINLYDINNDGLEEIVVSELVNDTRFICLTSFTDNKLICHFREKVPPNALYYDLGDLDNDGKMELVILEPNTYTIYYFNKNLKLEKKQKALKSISYSIRSPESNKISHISFIDNIFADEKNEFILIGIDKISIIDPFTSEIISEQDIRGEGIFTVNPETGILTNVHYTMPEISISDFDRDKKKEIIVKFLNTLQVFSITADKKWKKLISLPSQKMEITLMGGGKNFNVSMPAVTDLNNDGMKDIAIYGTKASFENFNIESWVDIFYIQKNYKGFEKETVKIDGVPANIPLFIDYDQDNHKDILLSYFKLNLGIFLALFFGGGKVNIPFYNFPYEKETGAFSNKGEKLFRIPVNMEIGIGFLEGLMYEYNTETNTPDFYFYDFHKNRNIIEVTKMTYNKFFQTYRTQTLAKLEYKPPKEFNLIFRSRLGNITKKTQPELALIATNSLIIFTEE